MKAFRYTALAAAGALAAFLLAPLFLRQAEPPLPRAASLEQRFPAHTEGWKRPAREEPRWREKRGHAFSLKDRDESIPDDPRWKRLFAGLPKLRPLPGGCLQCHGTIPARGPEWLQVTPYWEARKELEQPLGCPDCHDPASAALRLTRPAFPLVPRGHQELRALVCAQCHAEYYLLPDSGRVAYPWSKGLRLEDIEAHYDAAGFSDFAHAGTGARLLKAQHPQYEMWSQGVHARSGVTCADCHMPLVRQGAVRITDHFVRSPLEGGARACLHCHAFPADEMAARAKAIQERTTALLDRALAAIGELLEEAPQAGRFQRGAQFRTDFVAADGSKGFHAPQEALRLLAESLDLARQGQVAAQRAR